MNKKCSNLFNKWNIDLTWFPMESNCQAGDDPMTVGVMGPEQILISEDWRIEQIPRTLKVKRPLICERIYSASGPK